MSRDGEVPIACNACCNALVLYVTQGRAEGVSGAHTHTYIYTVCIIIRGNIIDKHVGVFKALM